ncbi:lipocalin-like domain-containing protein [Runella zeae]|uniref:lipocalin family protein n=1 Tax=Runella zeae TaxID=94255 RepID=UPI00048DA7B5|nr:lipocalin family protein [Runella zeae]
MKSILNVIVFGLMVAIASSCSEKLEPKPITYSQLLTGTEKKSWGLTSVTIVDQKDPFDLPGNQVLNPCALDDQFVFYADEEKKMEYTNGTLKCSASEPATLITDTWQLTNANATLEIGIPRIFGGVKLPFIIKTLTENTMVLEIFFDDIDASYRFTFNSSSK